MTARARGATFSFRGTMGSMGSKDDILAATARAKILLVQNRHLRTLRRVQAQKHAVFSVFFGRAVADGFWLHQAPATRAWGGAARTGRAAPPTVDPGSDTLGFGRQR